MAVLQFENTQPENSQDPDHTGRRAWGVVVHPYNRMLLSNKKDQTSKTCNDMDESHKHYANWKKPDSKGTAWFHLYDILGDANPICNRRK